MMSGFIAASLVAMGWNSVVPRSYQSLDSTLTPSLAHDFCATFSVS